MSKIRTYIVYIWLLLGDNMSAVIGPAFAYCCLEKTVLVKLLFLLLKMYDRLEYL